MEVSGQFHAPVGLPIRQEVGWSLEPVGAPWRREKYPCSCILKYAEFQNAFLATVHTSLVVVFVSANVYLSRQAQIFVFD
jgi:hypothetical protein